MFLGKGFIYITIHQSQNYSSLFNVNYDILGDRGPNESPPLAGIPASLNWYARILFDKMYIEKRCISIMRKNNFSESLTWLNYPFRMVAKVNGPQRP